jgi:ATP-binding cassette subfamily B protein RaxB
MARAREETFLMESIRAMRSIKLHSSEAMRENSWRNRYADVISANYRTQTYGIQLGFAESLLLGFQFLFVVYLGALAVMGQELTVGLLFAFLAYRNSFTNSAVALVEQMQSWRLIGVHLERLSDIVGRSARSFGRAAAALLPPPSIVPRI